MGALRTIWYRLEEGVIALLLAFMTILTFIQVVLRYGWGTGILWGQEAVLYVVEGQADVRVGKLCGTLGAHDFVYVCRSASSLPAAPPVPSWMSKRVVRAISVSRSVPRIVVPNCVISASQPPAKRWLMASRRTMTEIASTSTAMFRSSLLE